MLKLKLKRKLKLMLMLKLKLKLCESSSFEQQQLTDSLTDSKVCCAIRWVVLNFCKEFINLSSPVHVRSMPTLSSEGVLT